MLVEARLLAARLPLLGGPEARAIRRENLVDENWLGGVFQHAELELGIGQHDAAIERIVPRQAVEAQGLLLQPRHGFFADHRRALLEADVLVVAGFRLGRRGEQWLWQTVAVGQIARQVDAAHLAAALIVLPAAASQIAPGDAFHRQYLGCAAEHHAPAELLALLGSQGRYVCGVRGDQVIVHHAGEVLEPELGDLREHHALAGRAVGQHHIEGADAIGGHDQQAAFAIGQFHIVKIAHLAAAFVGQGQVRLHNQGWRVHACRVLLWWVWWVERSKLAELSLLNLAQALA